MATSRNDITGAALRTKAATPKYLEGYERVFGKQQAKKEGKFCQACRDTGLIHCSDPANCGGPWDDRSQGK